MAESQKPGVHEHAEHPIISTHEKPALDEATFQQLLEAAHVLQEQKASEVAKRPKLDATEALAEISETQEFLRSQACDLQAAASLIAEGLQRITSATGVAVAVARENQLEYCAATGDAAGLVGSRTAMDSSLSSEGRLFTRFSSEHPDKHSIALSLLHDGKLAGLLEVRFARADSIQEPEMRSCQLMAGLMTEVIARAADQEWKQTLAAERAAMLQALERIKPQLERLAVEPANPAAQEPRLVEPAIDIPPVVRDGGDIGKTHRESRTESGAPATVPIVEPAVHSRKDTICPQCGYQFGEHELFCGRCGTARPADTSPSGDLQSKWASLWHMQQAAENRQREVGEPVGEKTEDARSLSTALTSLGGRSPEGPDEMSPELEKMLAQFSQDGEGESAKESLPELAITSGAVQDAALVTAPEPQPSVSPWGSATNARQWLESFETRSPMGIWLKKHRADVYVGAAFVLLLLAWGMRTPENHAQAKVPAQPSLTLFEKMMVSLGLAETPPTPVYLGNPNAPVWVDLHTALYYCADADLYGKTPGGKFTTQRDAQLDQFEPAARKNCE